MSWQGHQDEKVKAAPRDQEDQKDPFCQARLSFCDHDNTLANVDVRDMTKKATWGSISQLCKMFLTKRWRVTFLADLVLESVADDHKKGFPEDKEQSDEMENYQLEECQDVLLDN